MIARSAKFRAIIISVVLEAAVTILKCFVQEPYVSDPDAANNNGGASIAVPPLVTKYLSDFSPAANETLLAHNLAK